MNVIPTQIARRQKSKTKWKSVKSSKTNKNKTDKALN